MRWPARGGNAVVLERDPLVRDQVSRLMGVLRQLAIAKNSPIRHTSRYEAALWLNDVQNYCTVQTPDGPGEELLRVAREREPRAPEVGEWIRPPDLDGIPDPMLHERGRRTYQMLPPTTPASRLARGDGVPAARTVSPLPKVPSGERALGIDVGVDINRYSVRSYFAAAQSLNER